MRVLISIMMLLGRSTGLMGVFAGRLQPSSSSLSPYYIILDGGSTGSRLHVYEFSYSSLTNITSCNRRLSTKAETPFSSFAPSPNTSIAQHLLPLFYRAAETIPSRYHSTTRVHYQATAGMRLLSSQVQEKMYDKLFDGLMEDNRFAFRNALKREHIGTLGGSLEAFHGALAANYLEGLVDVNLQLLEGGNDGVESMNGPLGALDMGGASMQIVYLPDSNVNHAGNSSHNCGGREDTDRLCEDEFFSESYLSYGVDQFRDRLWNEWIRHALQKGDEEEEDSKVLFNPCFFEGYTIEHSGYTLEGTGDAKECASQIRRLIHTANGSTITTQNRRMVGGMEHPPIRGKFFAMSLFFFSLDCLRELSKNDKLSLSWPTPSVEELSNALDGLCSRKWYGDLDDIKQNSHAFTSASVLPHRCFESVYMVTLLQDGFGFRPQSRDITFTYLVNGSEVEWSLGMALALFAQEKYPAVTILGKHDFDQDNIKEDERNRTGEFRGEEQKGDIWFGIFSRFLAKTTLRH